MELPTTLNVIDGEYDDFDGWHDCQYLDQADEFDFVPVFSNGRWFVAEADALRPKQERNER